MTLNSDFLVKDDDFSLGAPVLTIGMVKFWATLDSENRFYRYNFSAPKSYCDVFNFFGVQLLNKRIDELDNYLMKLYEDTLIKSEVHLFEPGLLYIKALIKFLERGLSFSLHELNYICLCSKLTEEEILNNFREHKGDVRLIKKQTDITMKCGGCQESFLRLIGKWEKEHSFYKGRDIPILIEKLKEALVDFHQFTSIDLGALELENIHFYNGNFEFQLKNNGIGSIEIKKLENSLVNFFASKLGEEIPILVTILE